jgi:hypothetical protein
MGDIFDSGSQDTVTQSQSQNTPFFTVPGTQEALADYVARIRGSAGRGYIAPPAISERISDFTQDELSGMEMLRKGVGAGDLDKARALFNQASLPIAARQWTDEGIADKYMNPYTQEVINSHLADMQGDRAMAEQALRGKQIASSGWGGSGARAVLERRQLADDYTEQFADQAAKLRFQGYDQAARLFGDDEARRLSALSDSSRMALAAGQNFATLPGAEIDSANALLASGSVQRGVDQSKKSMAYSDFLEKRDWDRGDMAWEGAALGALPWGSITGNTSQNWQTTSHPTPSFGQQLIGTGLAAAGTYGAYFRGSPGALPAAPNYAAASQLSSYAVPNQAYFGSMQ